MPRSRSPERDKAFEMWSDSDGNKPLKDIAEELGVSPSQIRNWKVKDDWDGRGKVAQLNTNDCATKRAGAPKQNKNAVGNVGGAAPQGNSNAVTHGFFRRIFPKDALPIVEDIVSLDPLDMLWQNIIIQYTAIARAQSIMFVRDQGDETKVLKRVKQSEMSDEHEWEYQHAWDKQATFMQAQSRAMSTLEGLISRYNELLPTSRKAEEHRLRIQKLQAEIEKLRGDGEDDDGVSITVDYGDDGSNGDGDA